MVAWEETICKPSTETQMLFLLLSFRRLAFQLDYSAFPSILWANPIPPPHSLLINSLYKRLISQSLFLLQAVNASYWFLPSFSVYWYYLSTFIPGTKQRKAAWSLTLWKQEILLLETQSFSFHDFSIVFKTYELPDIPDLALLYTHHIRKNNGIFNSLALRETKKGKCS